MKTEYSYLICDACKASAPTVQAAKAAGWRILDNVWLCDSCCEGTIDHDLSEDEDSEDAWIPDDGWC